MRNIRIVMLLAALSVSGCGYTGYLVRASAVASFQLGEACPTTSYVEYGPSGSEIHTNWKADDFLSACGTPQLQVQNQAGGWSKAMGWIDLPVNQGGLYFQVLVNGHFESYTAVLDGNPVGGGQCLSFAFGPANRDGGKHLLVIDITRRYSPRLRDPIPHDIVVTTHYEIIVFYKNSY